jgi:hypothetical protein
MRLPAVLVCVAVCVASGARAQDFKVEGALGTLDDGAVQLAVQKHAAAIEACFKEQAGTKRYLGGAVALRLRVARDGSVKSVVARSELGSWEVEKCLVGIARKVTFARPRGGEAEVELPLEFPPRSAPQEGDGEELSRKLDLGRCGRGPAGVQVTAYVGPGGRVTSAGFSADAAFPDAWGDCAAARARALKLRDPRGKVVKHAARLAP